ncbi:MAG: hypothetical protein M0Q53_17500 [Prolixibacteraceae bacterium]|jgi:hypothetical protein|nr:hypothetical protein [Prolixibacteraceae bacterium]
MKKIAIPFFTLLGLLVLFSCKKETTGPDEILIKDVGLKVSFQGNKSGDIFKAGIALTKETPTSYNIGLKSATLVGKNGTANVELFNKSNLSSSLVFDFTNNTTAYSLLNGKTIPNGSYSAIEFEVYYLQMNIAIATTTRGIERRNFRIYLSDDAETEGGLHQPCDMTQINNSQEVGWLMGKTAMPNMDPASPRSAAYSSDGNGVNWYVFGGKSAKDYGPFGNLEFVKNAPHPIFKTKTNFTLVEGSGSKIVIDFNVNNSWQFEDKNGDGIFGPQDSDSVSPTAWHMVLPVISVTQN